jgi:hypothetical protein
VKDDLNITGARSASLSFTSTLDEEQTEFYRKLQETLLNVNVHRERIKPNTAPGNVVVRVCTLHECLIDEVLHTDDEGESRGEAHARLASEALEQGKVVWTYFYDGDTGECMNTLIARPPFEAQTPRGH